MFKKLQPAARYFLKIKAEALIIANDKSNWDKNQDRWQELHDQMECLSSFSIFHLERTLPSLDCFSIKFHKELLLNIKQSLEEQLAKLAKHEQQQDVV